VPASAGAACSLALAETCLAHVAVGRRWACATREVEVEVGTEDEEAGEQAEVDVGAKDDPRSRADA